MDRVANFEFKRESYGYLEIVELGEKHLEQHQNEYQKFCSLWEVKVDKIMETYQVNRCDYPLAQPMRDKYGLTPTPNPATKE